MSRRSQVDDFILIMKSIKFDLQGLDRVSVDTIGIFRRDAIDRLAEECLKNPSTIIDSLTRRLGGISMRRFDLLVLLWWEHGDNTLMDYMLAKSYSYPHKHRQIQEIFDR